MRSVGAVGGTRRTCRAVPVEADGEPGDVPTPLDDPAGRDGEPGHGARFGLHVGTTRAAERIEAVGLARTATAGLRVLRRPAVAVGRVGQVPARATRARTASSPVVGSVPL